MLIRSGVGQAICMACVAIGIVSAAFGQAAGGPVEVARLEVLPEHGTINVTLSGLSATAPEASLLLMTGVRPVAWAHLESSSGSDATFRVDPRLLGYPVADRFHGWIVPPDAVSAFLPAWPVGGELLAKIDSLGPGQRTAWLRAGTHQGVRVGDCWWLRIGRQPAARFDVRFVVSDVCFTAVSPLAANPPLKPGLEVTLWPTPADGRDGRAYSAVAFVEEEADGVVVWVAAPQGSVFPAEPHVDFFRNGRYIGHGLVERRDDRFWYARLTPAVAGGSRSAPRPVSRPTSAASRPAARPQVGDEVVIRTRADIERRRFVARVFELSREGALVNAGEEDGLALGQQASVYHGGTALGTVAVRRVQSTYAVVTVAENAAFELLPADELRFGPLPAPPVFVGTIESVVDQTLFSARLGRTDPPLRTSLAIQSLGRTVGVALLVAAEGTTATGFAFSGSLTAPLGAGMTLVQTAPD